VVKSSGECGDDVVGLLERDRQRLDILSVKKEAKQYSSEMALGWRTVRVRVRGFVVQQSREALVTVRG